MGMVVCYTGVGPGRLSGARRMRSRAAMKVSLHIGRDERVERKPGGRRVGFGPFPAELVPLSLLSQSHRPSLRRRKCITVTLTRHRPDVLFSGAALSPHRWWRPPIARIPVISHESDATAGLATRSTADSPHCRTSRGLERPKTKRTSPPLLIRVVCRI